MAEKGGATGAGQVYPNLQGKRRQLLSTPSQTAQLEPGEKDSRRQLRSEYHVGGDREATGGQWWSEPSSMECSTGRSG